MSHFSKIKTIITDLAILKKTVVDLGFSYKSFLDYEDELLCKSMSKKDGLFVYDIGINKNDLPACSIEWHSNQYLIVVDFALWNLEIDFNYFMDRLLQQYAFNTVLDKGYVQGFHRVEENLLTNGSISLILQRF
uniref:Uncharacterized protein ycf35 n=1 Tax=Vertebrata lanosa TaxID=1261582 RepID=A0A0B5W2X3_9FLOR|nr:hypothetical protein [Vertebrata lanosa]AJH66034.1 hypothetical protein [Vertebrata lanosa]